MPDLAAGVKRLLVGRPVRSDRLGSRVLPKRLALPVFASDALSSVAYAPDEILLTLAVAGLAATQLSLWVGLAVVVVLVVVIASYRQSVHAYPSGGGDYEIASENLGPRVGVATASALLVDYVLTVAVSVSAGTQYAVAALPFLRGHRTWLAAVLVLGLVLVNLRGVRESGRVLAVPVYLFMAAVGLTAVVGFVQAALGVLPLAASAGYDVVPLSGFEQGLVGLAGGFLVLRAFASGSAALTGVEAISNGVPSFAPPKSRNAALTLLALGAISVTLLTSILALARLTGVRYVEDPATQLSRDGVPAGEDYVQHPVIGQLAETVFHAVPPMFYAVAVVTGAILVLAANTAFNGFPVLASILARDGYLPKQLQNRGDRLSFSNGVVVLGAGALALIVAFDASVTRLIQLYIVGVFTSFTISQFGLVRHWTDRLRTEVGRRERGRMLRSRAINAVGCALTGLVLVVALATKFTHGAWITVVAMAGFFALMRGIRSHYDRVRAELALDADPASARALPSRVHAIVLVSSVHKPTMRALAYARATRPSTLEAVTVAVDPVEAGRVMRQWDTLDLPVPLRVLDSPYREITRPVLGYVRSLRRSSPRDLVVVYIPETVVGHWWEQLLHNQSALRLKSRLLFTPGVVVASVPWQLASSQVRSSVEPRGAEPVPEPVPRSRPQAGSRPQPGSQPEPGAQPRSASQPEPPGSTQ